MFPPARADSSEAEFQCSPKHPLQRVAAERLSHSPILQPVPSRPTRMNEEVATNARDDQRTPSDFLLLARPKNTSLMMPAASSAVFAKLKGISRSRIRMFVRQTLIAAHSVGPKRAAVPTPGPAIPQSPRIAPRIINPTPTTANTIVKVRQSHSQARVSRIAASITSRAVRNSSDGMGEGVFSTTGSSPHGLYHDREAESDSLTLSP